MKCDLCGEEFHGPETVDTRSEEPSSRFRCNPTVMIEMCPECAARRLQTGRFIIKTFVLMIAGAAVAAFLVEVLRGR